VFVIFDNGTPSPADVTRIPQSKFFRDEPVTGTGGLAILRDSFEPPGLVVTLTNRKLHVPHQHYDPNGLSLSYQGQRFLVDRQSNMNGGYADPHHGFDREHSLVVIDHGGAPRTPTLDSEGSSSLGTLPFFLERGKDAIVVSDARYPAVDLSGYWNKGIVIDPSQITPALQAERTVLLVGDFMAAPLVAISDRYQLDSAAHTYSLLFQVADGTAPTGSGTLASPLSLTKGASKLYVYLGNNAQFNSPMQTMVDTGEDPQPDGGVAEHFVCETDATGVSARFLSLLVPTNGVAPTIVRTSSGGLEQYEIAAAGDSRKLRYYDNPSSTLVTLGSVQTDAAAFILGIEASGDVTFGSFSSYTTLTYAGVSVGGSGTSSKKVAILVFEPQKVEGRYTADDLMFTEVNLPILPAEADAAVANMDASASALDARAIADASASALDAATSARPDGAAAAFADASPPLIDGATDADAARFDGGASSVMSGCGCSEAGSASSAALAMVLALGLVGVRKGRHRLT
jgi:hypothetical protein